MHPEGEIPNGDVRVQLERILASQAFSRADRPGRFLRFLVEHALDGDAGALNEYTLALDIFNRKSSFDSASDPIVRVEAGRLRRKLQEYYQTEGDRDPVVIELPQRTYVPAFHRRQPEPPVRVVVRPWMSRPGSWKATLFVIVLGLLTGLAAYWAASALGRKHSPGPVQPSGSRPGSSASAGMRAIVVLPFTDLSPKHDQEYFCDGLTEELTETLTAIEGLRVVADTTAFHFKGRASDVREIGRQLNVGLILEGSVRKDGNHLRIAAQLIDAVEGYHLWSRTYDRELKDVLKTQQEIANAVVATGWTEFTGRWRRSPQRYTPAVAAYDYYLRGLYAARDWTTEGLTQAISEFERSIAEDPRYAPAHAALAQYYALLGVHAGLAPSEVMPKAKAAAIRALELNQSLGHAHASLALVKAVYDWDWAGAQQSFRRAFELDPEDADGREMYVMGFLVPQGRLDDALKEIQKARFQDPISPRVESILGMVYYFRRDYDLAIEQFRKPLELDPDYEAAHLGMGSAYELKSRFAEAIASLQEGNAAWRSGIGTSMLAHTYALMGRKAEAQKLIQELVELSKTRYISPAYVATIYAGLGDKDQAFDWLEKAYTVRAASLVYLKVNPRYDVMRSDPRFAALIKKIHLS